MFARLGQSLDPALFWDYRATLLAGLVVNIGIFVASAMLASVLAVAIGVARTSRNRLLRGVSTLYAELFRNTPEYVLLVWAYYVLPLILSRMLAHKLAIGPVPAAILALGFAYSGFMAETVRAGLLAVPRGHREAALALGISHFDILRRIVFPQALRRMLPDALNQYVSLFKATSIVSLISVEDIMYQVSMINVEEMRPLPLYTGAALLYCAIIIVASQTIQALTRNWHRRGWA
ncbi:MAG: amino acid ABC transporter permease [Acetobacteraceae bacterium]|nr:amino acid ABC transporter permease [Acetobacteraceae bacterium]